MVAVTELHLIIMLYLALFFLQLSAIYFLSRRLNHELIQFFYHLTKSKSWAVYLFSIVFLPGTFIHEISHFLAALFLLVPVGKLEIIPQFDELEKGVELGSVSIGKTDPVRRFLIGIAPFIFGTGLILATTYLVFMNPPAQAGRFIDTKWGLVFAGYAIFCVGNSMFASKKDLEGAFTLAIFLLIAFSFAYVLGIRIPAVNFELIFSEGFINVLRIANTFLLVPVLLDLVVLFLLKPLRRR